jgi:hypothetical protein
LNGSRDITAIRATKLLTVSQLVALEGEFRRKQQLWKQHAISRTRFLTKVSRLVDLRNML